MASVLTGGESLAVVYHLYVAIKVFLSHCSKDHEIAQQLRMQLVALGEVEPWLYEYDKRPGYPIVNKLYEEIRQSTAMIVLLTVEGRTPTVMEEVGIALGMGKPVIPIVEEGVDDPGYFLRGLEYISFDPSRIQDTLVDMTSHIVSLVRTQERLVEADEKPPAPAQQAAKWSAARMPVVQGYVSVQFQLSQEDLVALAAIGTLLLVAYIALRAK